MLFPMAEVTGRSSCEERTGENSVVASSRPASRHLTCSSSRTRRGGESRWCMSSRRRRPRRRFFCTDQYGDQQKRTGGKSRAQKRSKKRTQASLRSASFTDRGQRRLRTAHDQQG